MKTITKTAMICAVALGLMNTQANAGWNWLSKKGYGAGAPSNEHMPPSGYDNQWWTHPSGCEYSRAGRPGEIVWYVIINTIGNRSCPGMILQKAHADFQS